jgi:threonine dehydrogenase-like Zn-dependent dehydrogenase
VVSALVLTELDRIALLERPRRALAPGEARVRITAAGLCRSDLDAAAGKVPRAVGRTLGHEAAGVVVEGEARGATVALSPWRPCARAACAACPARPWRCEGARFLGVDDDGVFADEVIVDAAQLHRVPAALDPRHAAYLEPIAAALAVLEVPWPAPPRALVADGQVLVTGQGRIATLVARVVEAAAGSAPRRLASLTERVEAARLVIETDATPTGLAAALAHVAPGGTLVAKSRVATPTALDWTQVVQREVRVFGAAYAPFAEARAWLVDRRVALDDLIGPSAPLGDYAAQLARARDAETHKLFFVPEGA